MSTQNEDYQAIKRQVIENQKIIDELNQQLTRKTQQVRIIQEISTEINSTLDLERILHVILLSMDRVFGFRHSMILLLDASGEKLQVAASHGYEGSGIGAEVLVGQGTFGVVAKRKKIMRMGNIGVQKAYLSAVKAHMTEMGQQQNLQDAVKLPGLANVESQIAIPLLLQEQLVGVFAIESSKPNAFDELDEILVNIVANQAASAIHNAHLYKAEKARVEELDRAYAILSQLNESLEAKVKERTAELSRALEALTEKNDTLENTLQQLKAMQDQLIVQQKLASLGALTAGIAHEIKNPLNFVKNFAELSTEAVQELLEHFSKQKNLLDPETLENLEFLVRDLEENVQKIRDHSQRADSIVHNMLMHSRGSSGERQRTDLNALLAEYANLAYHGMRAKDMTFNATMKTELDPTIGQVEVVPQDLSRVFLNVLSNACYAVHEKAKKVGEGFSPTVWARTKNQGERIEIRIRDNGPGIPKEVVDKIFTPFFTTKPTGEGTGLGLSISYDIVVQGHQGEIKVKTEEGSYTEFIIALPIR